MESDAGHCHREPGDQRTPPQYIITVKEATAKVPYSAHLETKPTLHNKPIP